MQLTNSMRPKNWSELCGQDHISNVFKQAASKGELDNYRVLLFVGPRGCGKTTSARIVAKLHNCLDDAYVKQYGEPCGVCENCVSYDDNSSSSGGDIWEVDGGASGKVEIIKEILDIAKYSTTGKFKKRVFILDEAHQLSDSAKSALLKTMEEPPDHVVFILATTEGNKVPIPIQSRCQIFQFRMAGPENIATYLKDVLAKNSYTWDEAALLKVGELATGSYRDALQIVTKIFTMSASTHLSLGAVEQALGLPPSNITLTIIKNLMDQDPKETIRILRGAVASGANPEYLISEVVSKLGNTCIEKVGNGVSVIKGWEIPDLLELATYIKNTAPRFVGTNFGGIGASIALLMGCYWKKGKEL